MAPLHMHRRNSEERAIRNCKTHFISGLATTDPDFQISEWGRLLPQCFITFNLLLNSRINHFSFISVNKTPTYKPTYVRKSVPEYTRKNNYIAPNGQ